MYCDLREVYWWDDMKKDIAAFMTKCPNCQYVKFEHPKFGGLSQTISIPTSERSRSYDEVSLFYSRQGFYLEKDHAKLYLRYIVRLHGVPLSVIYDRGT